MSTRKNAKGYLTTAAQTIYTCPPGSGGSLVTLSQIANIIATEAFVTVQWVDASDSNAVIRLIHNGVIAPGDALRGDGGGFILEEGDYVQAYASEDDAVELTLGIVEG
jgi:hypothetical protein